MFFKQTFLLLVLNINIIFTFQAKDKTLDELKKEWIPKGVKAFHEKDTLTLINYTQKIDSLYAITKDSILLAKYYHFKALKHRINYKYDSVFYYYNESKIISKHIKDSLNIGRRLLSLGVIQRKGKDFLGAEISYIQALKYIEPINNYKYLEKVYNNLGIVSKRLQQKENALIYYNKALRINKITKNDSQWLHIMNNLGLLYQGTREHKKSIAYLKKGLALDSIKIKYPKQYTLLLENLTINQLRLGNKKNALKNYNEIINVRKKEENFSKLSASHILLTDFYINENKKQKALKHANEALKYAKKTHNNKRWLEALKYLADLHTGKKAVNYLNKYIQLNDSLIAKERATKNQFAKIIYETDKKETENSVLKIENDKKETEITTQKLQKIIGWLLFAASLFGLGFSILFFMIRRKKLIYNNQLQKIQAREKERQLIAKSLHDEVAGDLRILHQKLQKSQLFEEAEKVEIVKENVRDLSHKLSSVSFEKVSFKNQAINLVSDYFEPDFIIQVKGINNHDWKDVDNTIKRLLYLCMRECIQNCQKHANATKVTLNFSVYKKNVFLSILDNGKGFDTNISKKGIGLHNLEERLEELNGKLNIGNNKSKKGAKIDIQIPLNEYRNKNTYR